MSRSLYYVGGLAAMLLVVFAQFVFTQPAPSAAGAASSAAPDAPVAVDPASAAIDDLAAWPAAAGR